MDQSSMLDKNQQASSPSEITPRLNQAMGDSRTEFSTTIQNYNTMTRNNLEKSTSLNGKNYVYHSYDNDSECSSITDYEQTEIEESRNPFTTAVEEYKKNTILLGSSRKNKQRSPHIHPPSSACEVPSTGHTIQVSHNLKKIKKIMERHNIDELKSQEVDDTCFIANIIKGSPITKNDILKNKTPPIPEKTKRKHEITPKGKQDIKSVLDVHKLDIEELEFLDLSSSEEEEPAEISKQQADLTGDSSIRIEKESAREYFERLLQDAKKKEPKEVKDYERMADYALEKSLESLKKTIDDVDITKTESFQHISQRRRMYDSLKRGLGARDFMIGVAGSSEAADELLSKIGLSPVAPKTPSSPLPTSPTTNVVPQSTREKKSKRSKEEDDMVLERLSKPRSYQIYRKNDENKSFTHSVATMSEEFLGRMKNFEETKKMKLDELRTQMNQRRNMESSFSPRINSNSKSIQRNITSLLSWQKEKNMKQERLILQKKESESSIDCTFSPEISERSQRLAKRKPNTPPQLRD